MVFSLGDGEKFGDVVVAEPFAEPERTRLGAVRFCRRRRQNRVEAHAQRHVDDVLERPAQFGGTFPGFECHVGIKRQSGPHVSIMML